jgi:lipopolysaccharide transport system permease protein
MPGFLIEPFAAIFRHRELLGRTAITEVHRKYAGSLFGTFWVVASPLILMALYSLIYLVIFQVRPVAMTATDYVLYIFCGLIPFLGFMEALNAGASSLSLNKAVLLNTVFPSELVPVRAVLVAQGSTTVGFVIVILAAIFLEKYSVTLLLVPVIWFFLLLFVTGMVWVLALASLVIRDIQQMLAFFSIVLLIISPIAYTVEMVPDPMRMVVYLNPLSYFFTALQDAVVFGRIPAAHVLAVIILLGSLAFGAGFWVFKKAKQVFFDYA